MTPSMATPIVEHTSLEVLHIAAECYPVAKVGGLADVVGSLPKYQVQMGHYAKVIIPMYLTNFLYENEFVVDFKGRAYLHDWLFEYTVIKEKHNKLGYDLYLIDIPGLFNRNSIYGYGDDDVRFMAFQIAVLSWIVQWQHTPHIIHCHDHHTGFIPFMMQHCYGFRNKLSHVPSIFTIHNAAYQGWMGWDKSRYIPEWDVYKSGFLEWNHVLNPLSSAVRCAWKVTTVSNSYLQELFWNSKGLESLFEYEKGKCVGILNGIDTGVWSPTTDSMIPVKYNSTNVDKGKKENKELFCTAHKLDANKPLFLFIGRFAFEKGADILPDLLLASFSYFKDILSFAVLGSGDLYLEDRLKQIQSFFPTSFFFNETYNEQLSHYLYALSDFIIMPSRIEPCGLNQMYAMKYGTIPLVRNIGGLHDTIKDVGDAGWGFLFDHVSIHDIHHAMSRAIELYNNKPNLLKIRRKIMKIDHDWKSVTKSYLDIYHSFTV